MALKTTSRVLYAPELTFVSTCHYLLGYDLLKFAASFLGNNYHFCVVGFCIGFQLAACL